MKTCSTFASVVMRRASAVLVALAFLQGCRSSAPVSRPDPSEMAKMGALRERADIKVAFAHIESERDRILQEWIRLTAINAPSGQEAARAAAVVELLRNTSVKVTRDSAGNVLALRAGTSSATMIVLDAHLDTVFQPGSVITPVVRDGRLYAPGVGDNTRNMIALIAIIRALDAAKVQTPTDLMFLFTVEEETSFRGIRQFFKDNKGSTSTFIALDGGYSGFTYGGIGTKWTRYHFIGPGGHTRSSTPPYSATLPVARAITRISKLRVPKDIPSNLNIGMLGGAEVVNAKASDAWFSVDLRSTDAAVISKLNEKIERIVRDEAARVDMTVRVEKISDERPAQIENQRFAPLTLTTEAVHEVLGFNNPGITPTASNHSSEALREGISAISTGVAPCADAHAVTENCAIEPIYRGIRKVLLLAVAASEAARPSQ